MNAILIKQPPDQSTFFFPINFAPPLTQTRAPPLRIIIVYSRPLPTGAVQDLGSFRVLRAHRAAAPCRLQLIVIHTRRWKNSGFAYIPMYTCACNTFTRARRRGDVMPRLYRRARPSDVTDCVCRCILTNGHAPIFYDRSPIVSARISILYRIALRVMRLAEAGLWFVVQSSNGERRFYEKNLALIYVGVCQKFYRQ